MTLDQVDLKDRYRIFHPTTPEYHPQQPMEHPQKQIIS
jgi:hypothetical protein